MANNRMVQINKKSFQEVLAFRNVQQKEIAALLQMDTGNFSNILRRGTIDISQLNRICEYLNVPVDFITGELPTMILKNLEKSEYLKVSYTKDEWEIRHFTDQRKLLNLFMAHKGNYQPDICDNLTDDELVFIAIYIIMTAKYHGNILREEFERNNELEDKIRDLEKQLAELRTEGGDAKKPAAAKKTKQK